MHSKFGRCVQFAHAATLCIACVFRQVFVFAILTVAMAFTAHAVTYDLQTQFSSTDNPNGVWTYREGNNALPLVADWTPLSAPVVQPAWATGVPQTGAFIPAWFQSTSSNPGGNDIITGDVVVHSTDSFNGGTAGPANVMWTSPSAGTIDISGNAWRTRDISRSNDWTLFLNGVAISGGNLFSGDGFDRSNPFDFSLGTGGLAALTTLAVLPGDIVGLEILKAAGEPFGDFVGVNLTIDLAPVPLPAAFPLFAGGLGLLGLLGWRRKRMAAAAV